MPRTLRPASKRQESVDKLLEQLSSLRRSLKAALEEIPTAAFIVDKVGRVVHANAVGRAQLDRYLAMTLSELNACIEGARDARFRRVPIGDPGRRESWLLVGPPAASREGLVAAAMGRWALTARQGEILSLLVYGMANKTIAGRLGCAVKTVEQHVSVVLAKAGADTRAALAAKFWSSP